MDVLFNGKRISEAGRISSANGRVPDDEFMVGSWPEIGRLERMFYAVSFTPDAFASYCALHLCVGSG